MPVNKKVQQILPHVKDSTLTNHIFLAGQHLGFEVMSDVVRSDRITAPLREIMTDFTPPHPRYEGWMPTLRVLSQTLPEDITIGEISIILFTYPKQPISQQLEAIRSFRSD